MVREPPSPSQLGAQTPAQESVLKHLQPMVAEQSSKVGKHLRDVLMLYLKVPLPLPRLLFLSPPVNALLLRHLLDGLGVAVGSPLPQEVGSWQL